MLCGFACRYKIPSEHLIIFAGEHHLASLCGFTSSPFHLNSWTPLLLVPGFGQFPISIIIVPVKLVKLTNMNITRWPWWRTPPSKMCSSRPHPFQSSRECGRQSSSGRTHILVLKLFYNGLQWIYNDNNARDKSLSLRQDLADTIPVLKQEPHYAIYEAYSVVQVGLFEVIWFLFDFEAYPVVQVGLFKKISIWLWYGPLSCLDTIFLILSPSDPARVPGMFTNWHGFHSELSRQCVCSSQGLSF